jgi:hypothetical protein
MKEAVRTRQLGLPASVNPEDGRLLTLAEVLANPSATKVEDLPVEHLISLVRARWKAGEWVDVIWGTDGLIELDRGIEELEKQTDMGKAMMQVSLRALEMVHEDINEEEAS